MKAVNYFLKNMFKLEYEESNALVAVEAGIFFLIFIALLWLLHKYTSDASEFDHHSAELGQTRNLAKVSETEGSKLEYDYKYKDLLKVFRNNDSCSETSSSSLPESIVVDHKVEEYFKKIYNSLDKFRSSYDKDDIPMDKRIEILL